MSDWLPAFRSRQIEAEFTLPPKAGHFFLLTQPERTAQWLRRPLSTRTQ
jgi:pimeloyl-ACP methyl ester carboxylesterase